MSVNAVLVFCAQALLAQLVYSQCIPAAPAVASGLAYGAGLGCGAGLGLGYGAGLGYGYGAGLGYGANIEVAPTSGGALPVSSSSAIAPTSLSITSENVYEGNLAVVGELPFLSAVALEGVFPSGGAGVVNYSCGNGITAITNSAGNAAGAVGLGAAGIGAGPAGYGYGLGLAGISPSAAELVLVGPRACTCGAY